METDPKGQLGGLATGDDVRRKLARESREWRCSGCGGRTNDDIIKESEEAARVAEEEAGAGSSKSKEVEVPAELKLGFRDETEKAAAAAAGPSGGASTETTAQSMDDAETAELAEGFVQTVPRANLDDAASSMAASMARPGQTVLQPTRTIPLPNASHNTGVPVQQAQLQQRQITFNNGVPKWIDRVIAALAISLLAMILKVFLGY